MEKTVYFLVLKHYYYYIYFENHIQAEQEAEQELCWQSFISGQSTKKSVLYYIKILISV